MEICDKDNITKEVEDEKARVGTLVCSEWCLDEQNKKEVCSVW